MADPYLDASHFREAIGDERWIETFTKTPMGAFRLSRVERKESVEILNLLKVDNSTEQAD